MGTQLFSLIRRCAVLLIITAMVLAGMGKISTAAAAASTEQQAKQQKAENVIQIAQEYMKRGLYPQAQVQLASVEQEYGRFLTDSQKQKVAELKGLIQTALEERKKITAALEQSTKLLEQGNPVQAKEVLSPFQFSTFINDGERKLVLDGMRKADEKLAAQQSLEKQAAEQKALEQQKALDEQKALEQKALEQKAIEQKALEQKALEQKATEQKALEQQALEKQAEPQSVQTEPNSQVSPSQPVMTQVLPAQPEAAAAQSQTPAPEPTAQAQPQQETAAAQPVTESVAVSPQQENSYINEILRKKAVQISYTEAIVTDALSKADTALVKKDFEAARSSLRKAFSTLEHNRLLLEDKYALLKEKLTLKEEAVNAEDKAYTAQTNQTRQQQADQMTKDVREKMDVQRSQAVVDYMDRAYAFQSDERYDEALGQLEQLLAIDPANQNALIMKKTLENAVLWKEQLRIKRDADKQEIELILEANRQSIPYSKEINYPRNWKEISARRDKEDQKSPMDSAINKLLDQVVNLSLLTEETTLSEAIEILRNSVEPPLSITVMWKDLNENAFIQQDTPINMSGQSLVAIPLKMGLERVLQSVSAGAMATLGYVIEYGTITIATTDNLPTTYKNEVYDVSELLNPPANYDEYNGGISGGGGQGGGGMGGGGMGGGGGGMGGGGMGGGGMGGGGMMGGGGGMGGGGMMGGGGGGMGGGGMMGGGGGGMGGGMGGGGGQMVGNWQSRYRGYELMYTILQTVEPASWDPELSDVGTGEGRIMPFGDNQLIIWQTPPVQEKIRKFLDELGKNLGQQIAIEARFLLVDENYMKDVGLDTNIGRLKIGGNFYGTGDAASNKGAIQNILSNSENLASPSSSKIRSSVGGETADSATFGDKSALGMGLTYGGPMDDLQVSFLLKASQIHQNARQLTAPKAMVLSGESATLDVWTTKSIRTDSSLTSENITAGNELFAAYTIDDTYTSYSSGVRLSITPTILNKKYVLLRISTYLRDVDMGNPEPLTIGFTTNVEPITRNIYFPSSDLSSIQTRVSVPDRGTVLLGGQTLTASTQKEAGVPILSKIPILGRFFSNSSDVQDKRILLILVKPTIVLKEEAEEDAIAAMGSGS